MSKEVLGRVSNDAIPLGYRFSKGRLRWPVKQGIQPGLGRAQLLLVDL